MKRAVFTILKETLIQMIISVILVAIAAFVVLRTSPSENTIKIIILVIYGISSFVGGLILGKAMEKRRFLWGAGAGAIYIGILLLAALAIKGNLNTGTVSLISGIIVSVAAGTVGGILS